MTEPKYVATTLKTMLTSSVVKDILNRESNITAAVDEALSWWGYDLFTRKPSPAMTELGVFQGTDLDLACFLYELAGRSAVINIPYYKASGPSAVREDQKLKSKMNRHGELLEVLANKDFFSFSIRVMDRNVIGEDKVGDYRTFSLTEKDGSWSRNWHSIQFEPTLKENRFITENILWTGNRIIFRNFIHPNRWTSFFGHHYVISKMLIERLTDQANFLGGEVKRLQAAGIEFPGTADQPQYHSYSYGDSVSKTFTAFNAMIYIPESNYVGDYSMVPTTQKGLVTAYAQQKEMKRAVTKLRFMTRASEYAHFINPTRIPAWMRGCKWESDFIIPGKRVRWRRLKLFQPKVGEHSISILTRSFTKAARVAA